MNNIAIMPYIGLHALQIQNVKRNVAKKVSINEINNEVIPPNSDVNDNDTLDNEKQKNIDINNTNTNTNIAATMNDSHNNIPVAINSSSITFGSEINNIE